VVRLPHAPARRAPGEPDLLPARPPEHLLSDGVVAVLGVGKLGEALVSGLLRAGRDPGTLLAAERHPERATEIAARYGVQTPDPVAAAGAADVVLLAVKPQDMRALLREISGALRPSTLVVSMAAGITSAVVEAGLPEGTPVVRVMTNTPVFVDEAMSAVSAGSHATEAHLEQVEAMLRPVGKVVRVQESQQDAVTALSGSGPAYFFYLVESMIDAGILLGLPRAVAAELIVQTAVGSAKMLRESGEHPVLLREAVTSPGGTTISAIRTMEDHGVRAAMLAAIEAARDRSRELAGG
jgi:pyrroline-5-carboxylate reductase